VRAIAVKTYNAIEIDHSSTETLYGVFQWALHLTQAQLVPQDGNIHLTNVRGSDRRAAYTQAQISACARYSRGAGVPTTQTSLISSTSAFCRCVTQFRNSFKI
jgi:hypothetical protein